jgi:hypothetical protein
MQSMLMAQLMHSTFTLLGMKEDAKAKQLILSQLNFHLDQSVVFEITIRLLAHCKPHMNWMAISIF